MMGITFIRKRLYVLKRPKSDGRCIHCCERLLISTKDHVFPSSWYPDSTPADVQRWTVPSCRACNGKFGEIEKEVFVRLALCIDPRKAAAAGLAEKAVRSLGVRAPGISEKERRHREALKQNILKDAKPYTVDVQPHVLPGLGPHPEVPAKLQLQLSISGDKLISVVKKIVRGCEYWLAAGRIIDPPLDIEVFFVRTEDLPGGVRQLCDSLGSIHLGPGIHIRRGAAQDGSGAAFYEVVVWETLTLYAVILPPEVPGSS